MDRIYVSPGIEEWSGYTSIIAGFTYSDHLRVYLIHEPIYKKKSESNLKIPPKIFGIQKVKYALNNIWAASPSSDDLILVLEKKIINSSFVFQKVAWEELVRFQYWLQRLRKAIISAQKFTQVDPSCAWAKDRSQDATRMLFRKSAAWWTLKGDKVNRGFFLTKAPKQRGTYIQSLKQEDDSMTSDQGEILQITTNYYRDLLAPMLTNGPSSNLMHDILACLKTNWRGSLVVKSHREGRHCSKAREDT